MDRILGTALAVLWLTGCTGALLEEGQGGPGLDGVNHDGGPTSNIDTDPVWNPALPVSNVEELSCDDKSPDPGPIMIRRLTNREYNNAVRDLLGDDSMPATRFLADVSNYGFTTNSRSQLHVSDAMIVAYAEAALALSDVAIEAGRSFFGCDPDVVGEEACATEWLSRFGRRAYRRPLSAEEVADFLALFRAGRAEGTSFADGVSWVLQAMLQSVHFLYRPEFGRPGTEEGVRIALNGFEMATRLSFLVWGSIPDDKLLDAAAAGELDHVAGVEAQLQRMLADSKAHDVTEAFHREWGEYEFASGIQRDGLNLETSELLVEETHQFTEWAFWEAGKLTDLLAANVTFRNDALADHYGEPGPSSSSFEQVTPDPNKRIGFLTQGSLLTVLSQTSRTSPVIRGKFILERLMCGVLPDPPGDVDTTIAPADPGTTFREAFAAHSQRPECAGCHLLVDPLGFAFENYDYLGRWREDDNGAPVDATGELDGTDVDGPFDDGVDLANRLAGSEQVSLCFATQWYRFSMGRKEAPGDDCARKHIYDRFVGGNYTMKEILVGIATSDAFRYRRITEGGQ